MNKSIYFFCVAAMLLTVSCKNGNKDKAAPKIEVQSITLKDTTCLVEYKFPATIRGLQDVAIYPQVEGRITGIQVTEGQKVSKGQVLFVIDDIPYKAAYDASVASLEVAKSEEATAQMTLESKQNLFNENIISEYQLKLAQNNLMTAKARRKEAEASVNNAGNNLSFTRVKSPVDGYVGTLPYKIGSLVGSAMVEPLTIVSDNSSVYADFSLPESTYYYIAEDLASSGQSMETSPIMSGQISLMMNDGSRYPYPGKMHSLSGLFSKSTGALPARAIFPNPDRILMSGGSAQIVFGYEEDGVITIPRTAMKELQDKLFVFKIEDGKLKQTAVNAYRYNASYWILLPDEDGTFPLKSGDIITSTTNRLNDGDEVSILE